MAARGSGRKTFHSRIVPSFPPLASMRLSGVKDLCRHHHPTIQTALVDLLGQPIEQSNALCIPTAGHASSYGPAGPWHFQRHATLDPVGPRHRRPAVQRRRHPLPEPLDATLRTGRPPALTDRDGLRGVQRRKSRTAPRIGQRFTDWTPPTGDHRTLGPVDFSIFPHLNRPDLPDNTIAAAHDGPPRSQAPPTQSTTTPPSKSPTTVWKSSPKDTGNSSPPPPEPQQPSPPPTTHGSGDRHRSVFNDQTEENRCE